MNLKQNLSSIIAVCLAVSMGWADSLELKNGSLINGKFIGGTENEISFKVGSSVQKYNVADVALLKFDSDTSSGDLATRPASPRLNEARTLARTQVPAYITIPAGTRISVRTI